MDSVFVRIICRFRFSYSIRQCACKVVKIYDLSKNDNSYFTIYYLFFALLPASKEILQENSFARSFCASGNVTKSKTWFLLLKQEYLKHIQKSLIFYLTDHNQKHIINKQNISSILQPLQNRKRASLFLLTIALLNTANSFSSTLRSIGWCPIDCAQLSGAQQASVI